MSNRRAALRREARAEAKKARAAGGARRKAGTPAESPLWLGYGCGCDGRLIEHDNGSTECDECEAAGEVFHLVVFDCSMFGRCPICDATAEEEDWA
jgi:hypothetical protein